MIFRHMRKPLDMRKTRMGKRIYVQGVPLDTSWFCPYCCATVDIRLSSLFRGIGNGVRTPVSLTHLRDYSGPSLLLGTVSGRSHKETWAGCIVSLTTPTRSSLSASRSVSSLSIAEKASRVLAAWYFLR